jgi:hypothetical protein
MAGCAALQFFKGGLLRAFVTFMAALSACIIAFAWFEQIAALLIEREMFLEWAQALCLVILFIVAFAVLQTVALTLTKQPIDLGVDAERVGRIVFGLLLGFIISGLLLTAAAMTPSSGSFPYQRFDSSRPDPQNPHGALLHPDGFISRFFAIISSGSLCGSQSFAVLHADFIDELFLNRSLIDKKVSVLTKQGSVILPAKIAAWNAPNLKNSKGEPLVSKTGYDLIMVRVGFTGTIMREGGTFSPGQLRLMCKQKGDKRPLEGSAVDVFPAGYLSSADQLQPKGLADLIKIQAQDLKDNTAWIDFVFYVPAGCEPVALGFKANLVTEVPPLVSAEQAPKPISFISSAACTTESAKVNPVTSAKIYGLQLNSGIKLLEGTSLNISDRAGWTALQTDKSIMQAQFDQDRITCTKAELKAEPNKPSQQQMENKFNQLLKPATDYVLLSLKCNTPAVGSATRGEQLPCLIDSAGAVHYPCGVLAGGKVADGTVFEFDYCSNSGDITIADDGSVSKPFPESIWLTEQAKSITEFYVLYMVKVNTLIVSVRPAGAQTGASLEDTECFLAR